VKNDGALLYTDDGSNRMDCAQWIIDLNQTLLRMNSQLNREIPRYGVMETLLKLCVERKTTMDINDVKGDTCEHFDQ